MKGLLFRRQDFPGPDLETIHSIYVIRGVFISLTAVLLVGWLVFRTLRPLLATREWVQGERLRRAERLIEHALYSAGPDYR